MTRLVVALDTATDVTAVGIGDWQDGTFDMVAECSVDAPRAAMSRLLPCLAELLDALGVGPREIDEVVCGRGPGSFTGVRIGVASAKGLAQGLGVPLYGVGTLDAIAHRFVAEEELLDGGLLGVVGDAMRGEVYPALFRVSLGTVERLAPDKVARPDEAARTWAAEAGGRLVLAGNGLAKHEAAFVEALGERAAVAPRGLWSPTGEGLIAAFAAAAARGAKGDGEPGGVLPVYTRLSDAEEAERARGGLPPLDPPEGGVAAPSDGGGAL